ncbi:MAG: hypothetical protein HY843_04385 [Bdellovibrio sp.]|nr:hypothetical protein [Bdellovibrio sp.]
MPRKIFFIKTINILLLIFLAPSCALLVGQVKPVEEKTNEYEILDISKQNPNWQKLNPQTDENTGDTANLSDISDLSFQSKKTASVISLNTACRKSYEDKTQDLHKMTELLFMGISDISYKSETPTTLNNYPALNTIIQGKLASQETKLRAIVFQKKECVYDLMYVARPEQYAQEEEDFNQFVGSLKLK